MVDYNINNKEYLLSIKPSYKLIPSCIFFLLIIIIISICYFKTYDIYITKGYLNCEDNCYISLIVNIDDINKINETQIIKLNDQIIDYENIKIGDIQIDETNKINMQNVNIELNQLNDKYLNTFQDIKIYSNYESIFRKIKKIIL